MSSVPTAESQPDSDEIQQSQPSALEGLGKHSLIYAIGVIVGRAVSFLMLPIYTRYLTPADYGVLALVELTLDFISILAGARLALGVFRFYHKADTETEREQIVSTSFLLIAIMYSFVGLATFAAAELLSSLVFGSGENALLIRIAAVNVALNALAVVPFSLARVKDRSVLFVGANIAKALLSVTFVLIFLVGLDLGVLGVFLATLVSNLMIGSAMTIWMYRAVPLGWDSAQARQLLRYGIPLVATQFATWIATFSDRFFLQSVADEAEVGLYNLAYQFGFIMLTIGYGPIDQVWNPRRFRAAREANSDELLSRGFLIINLSVLTVAVGISLFVFDLLRIMATPPFFPAAQVVPLILVAYILQCWSTVQDVGILVSERTEYVTLANVIAGVVAVAGYALLIPKYLAWGAASATLAAFAVRYILTYYFSQRLWRIEYRWKPVVVLVGWACLIAGAGLLLPELPIVPSVLVRSGLGVAYLAGVWWLPILGEEDRVVARQTARTVGSAARAMWVRIRRVGLGEALSRSDGAEE